MLKLSFLFSLKGVELRDYFSDAQPARLPNILVVSGYSSEQLGFDLRLQNYGYNSYG